MTSSVAVAVSLFILVCTSTCGQECTFWKSIIESPGLQEYVLAVAQAARLDIGLPPEFGDEDARLLATFLDKTPIATRIFTKKYGFCENDRCDIVRRDRHAVMLPFCRTTVWTVHDYAVVTNQYVMYLYVMAADLSSEFPSGLRRLSAAKGRQFQIIKGSGAFNFTFRDGRLVLTENYQVRTLDTTRKSQSSVGPQLLDDLPLRGTHVRIWCLYPYFCKSPKFLALREILSQINSSFEPIPITDGAALISAYMELFTEPASLVYFHSFRSVNVYFPRTSAPCNYDLMTFSLYVKGKVPMAREAVLLLPFTHSVWFAFLVSFVVCVLLAWIIAYAMTERSVYVHLLAGSFAASFLQQGCGAPLRMLKYHSFRILLGVWSIMATVMATGFRGLLVSLLWKVPLQGHLPEVTTTASIKTLGLKVCYVTHPLDHSLPFMVGKVPPFVFPDRCLDSPKRIRLTGDPKVAFMLFGSGFPEPDDFKDQLLRGGYVAAEAYVPTVVSGPELKASSAYRKAFGRLLTRAFEAGIFEGAVRRAQLKRTLQRGHTDEAQLMGSVPMTLSDLRPCFIILVSGLVLSLFTLTVEVLIAKFPRKFVPDASVARIRAVESQCFENTHQTTERSARNEVRQRGSGNVKMTVIE